MVYDIFRWPSVSFLDCSADGKGMEASLPSFEKATEERQQAFIRKDRTSYLEISTGCTQNFALSGVLIYEEVMTGKSQVWYVKLITTLHDNMSFYVSYYHSFQSSH